LTRFGEQVQEALEAETRPTEQLRLVRPRLLQHVTDGRPRARRRALSRWRHVGIAAAAALALLGVALGSWYAPISFRAGSREGQPGDVLAATERAPLRVEFSEGSLMLLHRSAAARVLETRAAGARVLLESGVADVSITHRTGRATRWRFEAGPFQILVTGTQFEFAWQPALQSLSLTMKTGSVEVSGACLPKPRRVEGRASLRLSCAKTEPPAERPIAAPEPAPVAVDKVAAAEPAPVAETKGAAAQSARPSLRPEPRSFERSCETADKDELVALANRERLVGSVARARTALLSLRRCFPGSKEASTAAFALGRMAFDQRAEYAEAARWFGVYLAEQPDGPLMGDARGRLLEAHERLGNTAAGRRDAESYLRRFPDGPYADQARRILAQ
jgi:transmembrane sensor